jgi:hypothetical protein
MPDRVEPSVGMFNLCPPGSPVKVGRLPMDKIKNRKTADFVCRSLIMNSLHTSLIQLEFNLRNEIVKLSILVNRFPFHIVPDCAVIVQ